MAFGKMAQSQAAVTATDRPAIRSPAWKMGTQVSGRTDDVEQHCGEIGGKRVGAEQFEDSGQDEGIDGRHPGGRAGGDAQGRAEAVSVGEGEGDIARFEEKRNDA